MISENDPRFRAAIAKLIADGDAIHAIVDGKPGIRLTEQGKQKAIQAKTTQSKEENR